MLTTIVAVSAALLLLAMVAPLRADELVYEIAIQSVKPETAEDYPTVRADFLRMLSTAEGVEKDWTLKSFFSMPTPDSTTVLVGITRWRSQQDFNTASTELGSSEQAGKLFSMVDMRAFIQVRPVGAASFQLEDHFLGGDQVLEVAVRTPAIGVSESDFQNARDAFFAVVRKQPGFLFDQEFTNDAGTRVVMIGWASTTDFQAALGVLQNEPTMGAFFSKIDVQAYQAARLQ